ncbi:MAG: ArnT family glycosyltransferase [Halothece sp.]
MAPTIKKAFKPTLIFNLYLPLLFVSFVITFMPLQEVFQYDSDEGIQLAKAMLYQEGFQLYSEIWNDQPPLSTVVLAAWLQIFGHSIVAARLLTLVWATVLIWTVGQLVRHSAGTIPALLAVVWLTLSSNFLQLSVSVMIGLPAIALALLSLFFINHYLRGAHWVYLLIAGASFALSLQTKAFTAFLLPLFLLPIFLPQLQFPSHQTRKLTFRQQWQAVVITLLSFAGVLFLTWLLLPSPTLEQIVGAHFNAALRDQLPEHRGQILVFLGWDYDYLGLLLIGLGIALWRDRALDLPFLWWVTALILLLNHHPVWYHHYLLLTVPMAFMMAEATKSVIAYFRQTPWRQRSWFSQGILAFALFLVFLPIIGIPIRANILHDYYQRFVQQSQRDFKMIEQVLAYQEETEWLFTDFPIYGFYANLKIPPEIAVFSRKRLESEKITEAELQSVVENYQPKQILMGRFGELPSILEENLRENYTKAYEQEGLTQYLRDS